MTSYCGSSKYWMYLQNMRGITKKSSLKIDTADLRDKLHHKKVREGSRQEDEDPRSVTTRDQLLSIRECSRSLRNQLIDTNQLTHTLVTPHTIAHTHQYSVLGRRKQLSIQKYATYKKPWRWKGWDMKHWWHEFHYPDTQKEQKQTNKKSEAW